MDGGYDIGYKACPCFWGSNPGSLVQTLETLVPTFSGMSVLDAGCGEGKNAIFLASKGAKVTAYDISELAIRNAKAIASQADSATVSFTVGDIRNIEIAPTSYDVILAYGLMHCLPGASEIRSLCRALQEATRAGGYMLLCAFNDRCQDLSAHPGFHPTLLPHAAYMEMFNSWELVEASDQDLHETHPHNNIPHTHSMTRILAKRKYQARQQVVANV
jgi:tellurite methyltransferase